MPKEVNEDRMREFLLSVIGISPTVAERYLPTMQAAGAGPIPKENEVLLMGPIVSPFMEALASEFFGPGLVQSYRSFAKQLEDKTGDILIRCNSPGGILNEASGIRQAIQEYQKDAEVNVLIQGMAASAASFCIMSANRIEATEVSTLMIHGAQSCACGTAEDFAKMAEHMNDINMAVAKVYAGRCGETQETMLEKMKDETWYSAEKALDCGMIDAVAGEEDEEVEMLTVADMEARYNERMRGFFEPQKLTGLLVSAAQ